MNLKYGSGSFHLSLPQERLAGLIEAAISLPEESPTEIIARALDDCQATLANFSAGRKWRKWE